MPPAQKEKDKNGEFPSRLRVWLNRLPIQDPIERRMASLLQVALMGLCSMVIVGTIAYLIIGNLSPQEKFGVLTNDLVGLMVAGLPLLLLRRGHFRGSVLVIIIILFITPTLAVVVVFDLLHSGGILFQYTLAIILAGLLINRRALTLILALSVGVVGFAAFQGQSVTPSLANDYDVLAVNFVIYNTLIALFIDQFGITLRTALTDALEREKELQREVAERKRMEEKLKDMSIHDALTGLFNRRYFEEEMIRLERGRSFPVSIIIADMDNLKKVNDREGHAAGDKVLKQAAQLLTRAFRAGDLVARIGGDEFGVILPATDRATVKGLVQRVRQVIREHHVQSSETPLSLSLGESTADHSGSLTEILKDADEKMYQDKQSRAPSSDTRE